MTTRFPFPALVYVLFFFIAVTGASAQNFRATYGSRGPRTCASTKAPASGPISAQQALQYFICRAEHVYGDELYLVGDVQLQIGKGRPFQINSDRLSEADTDSPVYPIRGSFIQYQVHPLSKIYPNDGKNCTSYAQRNASGVCYRTTFGDWKCSMLDTSNNNSDRTIGIAPPQ